MLWEAIVSLFEEIQNKSKNKYIEIGCAIESLAFYEGGIYKAVMVMLHYKFDELLSCFKQGKFYEFIDIDNDQPEEYSSFQILRDVKQDIESRGGIQSEEYSLPEELKEKIKNYYWNKKDYSNLEPIKKIHNISDTKTDKMNNKKQVSLKNSYKSKDPHLSVFDAFEFIKETTDLELDCDIANYILAEKINIYCDPYNKFKYFDGKPTPLYKELHYNNFTEMDLLLQEIARGELNSNDGDNRLKSFAWNKDDFIDEFNSTVDQENDTPSTDQSSSEEPTIKHPSEYNYQQKNLELIKKMEQFKKENETLKVELLEKDKRIKEPESTQTNTAVHPSIDPENKNHAPELILAIQAWEAKYINNEQPHKEHTPAIRTILQGMGINNERLKDRISAITNPNKNI